MSSVRLAVSHAIAIGIACLATWVLTMDGWSTPRPSQKTLAIAVALERFTLEGGEADSIAITVPDEGDASSFRIPEWAGSYLYIVEVNSVRFTIRCTNEHQCEAFPSPIG